jgi:hypothetical protein
VAVEMAVCRAVEGAIGFCGLGLLGAAVALGRGHGCGGSGADRARVLASLAIGDAERRTDKLQWVC